MKPFPSMSSLDANPARQVKDHPLISLITPLYNEEAVLPHLAKRLRDVFASLPNVSWEWIAVDDGSRDQTFELAAQEMTVAPRWQLLQLSRNFGQQAAYRAGLDLSKGDAVIFLDADMQDPPEKIPEMIDLWLRGNLQVVGRRQSRPERGFRGLCLRAFHELFHRVTGGVIPKDSGTFALMDRCLVDELKRMPERGMFLPAQRGWLGFPTTSVSYHRSQRTGDPKQSYMKLFSYAWEGITSFSVLPLQLISLSGLVVSLFGFGYAAVLLAIKVSQMFGWFQELKIAGFTTISVSILCLGGIQLLSLGVIGSYLAKVFYEVKSRPFYIKARHLGSPPRT
jgi:glycosyltransferase involved in cell wall biosynthesis